MAAHRYWRFYDLIANNLNDGVGTREIELRTSIGGSDQTGSGTASASHTWYPASDAVDNNTSSGWWTNSNAAHRWWKYDFGSGNDKDIVEVVIGVSHVADTQSFSGFDLQYSDDDSSWTTLFTVYDPTGWDSTTTSKTYSAAKGLGSSKQSWRLKATAINSGAVIAIREMSMRLTAGGSNQCSGGEPLGSSQFGSGSRCTEAYDGGSDTWTSSGGTFVSGEWVGYKFTSSKNIVEMAVTVDTSSSAPKDFTLEYWDGSAWQVAATYTGETGWSAGETRTYTFGSSASVYPVVFAAT